MKSHKERRLSTMTIKYVIKKMARVHCAKGPENCRNCKKYAKGTRYGLLDITPEEHPVITRPMIEIKLDGEKIVVPYELIAYFYKLEDAEDYAKRNEITFELLPD